jgi:hypothetical protein
MIWTIEVHEKNRNRNRNRTNSDEQPETIVKHRMLQDIQR